MTELERLGSLARVDPPAPGVLDAAREVLWSAVAAEMLATAPDAAHPDAAHPDAAHPDAAHPDAAHLDARTAEEAADRLRRENPGAR